MPFDLTIGDSPTPARVTFSLYDLVSTVLHREFDFPLLIRMFTLGQARFDANELLVEAEMIKDVAMAHHRPFVDVGSPLQLIDLEGLLNFPELLPHGVQIVTDWTEIVPIGDGESALAASPPTLLSGHGKLHLVDAVAFEVASMKDWTTLPHVSARTFSWEFGQLLADDVPQPDAPSEFLRPWRRHASVTYADVALYQAWADELESLIDACKEGVAKGQPINTRT